MPQVATIDKILLGSAPAESEKERPSQRPALGPGPHARVLRLARVMRARREPRTGTCPSLENVEADSQMQVTNLRHVKGHCSDLFIKGISQVGFDCQLKG